MRPEGGVARKRWQQVHGRGAAVNCSLVRELAAGARPGTTPVRVEREGQIVVHYRRPRMHLDRSAWESLPASGILLVHILDPNDDGDPVRVALTRDELERVFGEVRDKPCWTSDRCYHFATRPPALASFVVENGCPPASVVEAVETARSLPMPPPLPPPTPVDVRREPSPPVTSLGPWLRGWEARLGVAAEPEEYRDSVRAWRDAWRPPRVRSLLIAESHVGPRPGDDRVRVAVADRRGNRDLPRSYCRLVYCLGYGEGLLCSPSPQENAGTRAFWNIFAAVGLGTGITQPTGSGAEALRVEWKLGLLHRLRDAGVWLVDASVLPLYDPTRPKNKKKIATGESYRRLVRESFSRFVWPDVADEPLEQVWIVGLGVGRSISDIIGSRLTGAIEQPGPGRGQHQRHVEGLARMATSVRALP